MYIHTHTHTHIHEDKCFSQRIVNCFFTNFFKLISSKRSVFAFSISWLINYGASCYTKEKCVIPCIIEVSPLTSEPSALEGLLQGFISSPLSFLIRLSSVDWPSRRSERHGHSLLRFPLQKRFCLDHSCFNSCFDLFILGSTLQLSFCLGQEWGAPYSAVSFKRDLCRRQGMSGR